jgi:hypothetical protein
MNATHFALFIHPRNVNVDVIHANVVTSVILKKGPSILFFSAINKEYDATLPHIQLKP